MSSVSPLSANGYYSLNNQSASAGTSSATTTALSALATAGNAAPAATPSLAYILNLSDAAQSYLGASSSAPSPFSIPGLPATASASSASQKYTLTTAQQKTLTTILAKYKDAPYTQDTFNQIQDDLNQAGLSTTALTAQDQAKSFNPTQFLLNALNGNSTPAPAPTAADANTKANNFINSIISQWQSISTTADAATDTTATGNAG